MILKLICSTVGYGDISPPDTQSRMIVVLLVGFFFFMIPREINKLNQLLDLSSKYTVRGILKLAVVFAPIFTAMVFANLGSTKSHVTVIWYWVTPKRGNLLSVMVVSLLARQLVSRTRQSIAHNGYCTPNGEYFPLK